MFKFLIVLVFIESKTSLKFYAYYFFQTSKVVAQRCSVKKVSLEISQNSLEYICARAFFYKVAGLRPATLLKKRLWHWCFPVNFTKFLRRPFSQNTSPLVTETFNKYFIRHLSLDVFNPVIPQSIQKNLQKKLFGHTYQHFVLLRQLYSILFLYPWLTRQSFLMLHSERLKYLQKYRKQSMEMTILTINITKK